ncbi:hypothetical protein [uncultured Gimesia sp.]|uniref:hypothetical protein n=1 Tax=uncultured Gimesia sp. TaxID=1678688 RepID=UPI002617973B|nr:hypothetical protein [uncultured Gimesia sp.]
MMTMIEIKKEAYDLMTHLSLLKAVYQVLEYHHFPRNRYRYVLFMEQERVSKRLELYDQ